MRATGKDLYQVEKELVVKEERSETTHSHRLRNMNIFTATNKNSNHRRPCAALPSELKRVIAGETGVCRYYNERMLELTVSNTTEFIPMIVAIETHVNSNFSGSVKKITTSTDRYKLKSWSFGKL